MAEKAYRLPQNAPGAYYIDNSCIDCDMCRTSAPEFFTRNDDIASSIVHHQPQNADERAAADQALSSCPTDSIGKDGM